MRGVYSVKLYIRSIQLVLVWKRWHSSRPSIWRVMTSYLILNLMCLLGNLYIYLFSQSTLNHMLNKFQIIPTLVYIIKKLADPCGHTSRICRIFNIWWGEGTTSKVYKQTWKVCGDHYYHSHSLSLTLTLCQILITPIKSIWMLYQTVMYFGWVAPD